VESLGRENRIQLVISNLDGRGSVTSVAALIRTIFYDLLMCCFIHVPLPKMT
jgi:hypothetical protein